MSDPVQSALANDLGIRHYYGGIDLPPGGVAVEDRDLARYVIPGTTQAHHGIVPIGVLGLPMGSIMTDLDEGDVESIRCLPFRFPWYRQAYALKCSDRIFAVVRNVQSNEVRVGSYAVVQLNDAHHWETTFGRVKRLNLSSVIVQKFDGEELKFQFEHIHFVGKITYWWDDRATGQTWIELPEGEAEDGMESHGS